MGHAIPTQHPAVVLRSHFNLVRALLGIAMIAVVGLTIALVIVASDGNESAATRAVEATPLDSGSNRSYSGAQATRKLDGSIDGRSAAPASPGTRYDGGPEEGTRGAAATQTAPGIRYDGGPEEGTRGNIAPQTAPEDSQSGPGFRTD